MQDNDKLFFKVWKNIVIRNEIIRNIRLFKEHSGSKEFYRLVNYKAYENKDYLTNMTIGIKEPITVNLLPPYLDKLIFYAQNGQIKANSIPNSVKELIFSGSFNQVIVSTTIPKNVEIIQFGDYFNQPLPIGSLPQSIKRLEFGNDFNQEIQLDTLPKSRLEYLKLGVSFNKLLKPNYLPKSLTHLILSNDYDHHIDIKDVLPDSGNLLTLNLGENFNKPLKNHPLPYSITHLVLSSSFDQHLPAGVLPQSLKRLEFGRDFNKPINVGVLPDKQLESIIFGFSFNQQIKTQVLPNTLKEIKFGFSFNQIILENSFPQQLLSLEFGGSFSKPINSLLPTSLESLKLGYNWDFSISNQTFSYLSSLHSLEFGYRFQKEFPPSSLPDSLTFLKFACSNNKLQQSSIPKTVKILKIGTIEYKMHQ
ncbi:hypothetical protein ACTFIR_011625 [Dictyostelium discoideum]